MTPASARQTILDRIRAATSADADTYADIPRNYTHRGALDTSARLRLMTERLLEYGAEVVEASPADLPATIAHQLQSSGRRTFVAPPGLPADWLARDVNWKLDNDLSYDEIERCDGVLTALLRRRRGFGHHRPSSLAHRRPPRPHPATGLPPLHPPRFANR